MKLTKISNLFDVLQGNGLELNRLAECDEDDPNGVNFVSRTRENNGISATVYEIDGLEPFEKGLMTVAGSGNSVTETFVQPSRFYTGYHVFVLRPKREMTINEKLYYCYCIKQNRFRYSYGRQANKTLKKLLVPSPDELPDWINQTDLDIFKDAREPILKQELSKLNTTNWKPFKYSDLFDIERGKGPRKKDLDGTGETPVVTSSDKNNGWTAFTTESPCHDGGTIGVNRNGSVGEAFYQPVGFCSTEDVHIFTPKFEMNKYVAMFLCCLIRAEKYRFNYGRKWGIARMEESIIRLPVKSTGEPDWDFMENYIKSLPYSSSI